MNIVEQLLKIDAKEVEMPKGEHKMFCKKLGQEFVFPIEAIDPERVAKNQERAIDLSKGEISKIDTYALKVLNIIDGCPTFKDTSLMQHFEAASPKELVKKLLLSGEMDSLSSAINELNGVTEDEGEIEEEIKN